MAAHQRDLVVAGYYDALAPAKQFVGRAGEASLWVNAAVRAARGQPVRQVARPSLKSIAHNPEVVTVPLRGDGIQGRACFLGELAARMFVEVTLVPFHSANEL